MNEYQRQLIDETEKFRRSPKYATYPPYHEGLYLEDLFFEKFINHDSSNWNKIYIPIFWTTTYNDSVGGLQEFLNKLDNKYEYFTVSQHDDAVKENLPINTLVYSAGGNRGNIPVPLVCSKIPEKYLNIEEDKKFLASFVGSMTHPIRNLIYMNYGGDKDFLFKTKSWNPKITQNEFESFFSITKQSKFTLCPRGYGKTSFRLYETFQLNSVPIYVSDDFWLPFQKEIDWNEICVLIKPNEIGKLKEKLLSINDEKYSQMIEKGKKIWDDYFEINKVCEKIINEI